MVTAGIVPGSKVTVTPRDGSVITGRVEDVGTDTVFITDSETGTLTQVPVSQVLDPPLPRSKKWRIIVGVSIAAAVVLTLLVVRATAAQ